MLESDFFSICEIDGALGGGFFSLCLNSGFS